MAMMEVAQEEMIELLGNSFHDKDTNQMIAILNNLFKMYGEMTYKLLSYIQDREDYHVIVSKLEFEMRKENRFMIKTGR